jgi:hypothetical protein
MRLSIVVLAGVLAITSSTSGQAPESGGIQRAAWLQGCWESATSQGIVEEHWMAPRGRNMVGLSRTVNGERLVAFELVVLREQDEHLAYEAHPSGQKSAVFVSSTVTDSDLLFENPKHDFPQRVGYKREGSDLLHAWIEGVRNGQPRRVDFEYRRVKCPGQQPR